MPEETERNYHIGYAMAALETLSDDIGEALAESWKPGTTTSRYGRTWHLTKVVHETPSLYYGRIGFVNDDELSTLKFDPVSNDFVYGEAPSGVVVPFVVRKLDGVIAFQLYPGVVRETTFTGALQDLLNSASGQHVWRVKSFVETREFDEWLAATEGVTKFNFTLERPNPNYVDRERIEEIIEDLELEVAKLSGRAREGESVNVDAEIFREALDHVMRDYGKAKIVGRDREGSESTWVKLRGMLGRVAQKKTRRGVGTEQAPEDVLREVLDEAPISPDLADLSVGDEE